MLAAGVALGAGRHRGVVKVSKAGFEIAAMELAAAEVFFGVIWLKSGRSRLVAVR